MNDISNNNFMQEMQMNSNNEELNNIFGNNNNNTPQDYQFMNDNNNLMMQMQGNLGMFNNMNNINEMNDLGLNFDEGQNNFGHNRLGLAVLCRQSRVKNCQYLVFRKIHIPYLLSSKYYFL